MMTPLIFNADDIFEDIPGDSENVLLKFPPEILEQTGWKTGDTLDIKLENGAIVVTKHE
jgi:antitoxin component of MazEF toxin-antitoxin module